MVRPQPRSEADLTSQPVWVRQPWESEPAYTAFRAYQRLRNLEKVANELGKNIAHIRGWSASHLWRVRITAMDNHVATAEVDSYAEELAKVKNRHMQLTDKLLDHLNWLLDQYIAKRAEVSVRWTQAFVAATKAQEAALKLRPMDMAQASRLDDLKRQLQAIVEGELS